MEYQTILENLYNRACAMPSAKVWQNMLGEGRLVDAIRFIRIDLNIGLKEAKDVCELWKNREHERKSKEASDRDTSSYDGNPNAVAVWYASDCRYRVIEMRDGSYKLETMSLKDFDTLDSLMKYIHS